MVHTTNTIIECALLRHCISTTASCMVPEIDRKEEGGRGGVMKRKVHTHTHTHTRHLYVSSDVSTHITTLSLAGHARF